MKSEKKLKIKSSKKNEETYEERKPNFFGIKSYLHHFYDSHRNPRELDEENNSVHIEKDNSKRILWKVILIAGFIIMLLGISMLIMGFTFVRMKIDIGYQEEMRIIDKSAYEFNKHLDQIKIIGLIFFAAGGILFASSLLLPSLLPNRENEFQEESTHLKLNIGTEGDDDEDDDDEGDELQEKNLIPVTEELKIIQPKQSNKTIITNSGLKQINLD